MSHRRKKRRKGKEEVELNLAAMLDMAFQLLTFFILTFKPAPVEGQITLRLPPPMPVTGVGKAKPGEDLNNTDVLKSAKSLIISVLPGKNGNLGSMQVGEDAIGGLPSLNNKLQRILGQESNTFDQVIIQAGSGLRYDALMQVVDVCTRQEIALAGQEKKRLAKLSFVELPDGT